MRRLLLLFSFLSFLLPLSATAEAPRTKIGVQLALTGDLAQSGTDMLNAIKLANELLGENRYDLIVEDDQCVNRTALSIAQKFINIDKVKYVLGLTCNQTLMAIAPIYEAAGTFVLASSATSGDVLNIGRNNFRLFPSDMFGAKKLFDYLAPRIKSLAIIAEQTEYTTMMERSFRRFNAEAGNPIQITTYPFSHSDRDLKTLLLKAKASNADAIYLDADSDTSYITLLKQLAAIRYDKPRYTVYLGASESALKEVPRLNEGVIFSNLPSVDKLFSSQGAHLLKTYRERFGEPKSGFPVMPTALESFRILDLALRGGKDPTTFLKGRTFTDGYLPPYGFDENGNSTGFKFEMQQIRNGKVEIIE